MRLILLLSLILILLGGCKASKKRQQMPPSIVEVTEAKSEPIANSMEFIGVTSSNYDVYIEPRVNGFLTSIEYKKGMPVKKGDILYLIDPATLKTEVDEAKSLVETAKAELVEAQNNYYRAVPLAKIDAISQSSLDQYEAEYKSAQASLVSARSKLTNAQINLEYTIIRSPIDGVIGETDLAIGQYVGPSSSLSNLNTISNIDSILVEISLPMSEYLKVVMIDSIDSPSYDNSALLSNIRLYLADDILYPYQGQYLYTKKDVGSSMGTLEIVVMFPNPQRLIKGGESARIVADVGDYREKVIVPQVCVDQSQNISSVWVVNSDSVVNFKLVKLGKTQGDMWIVEEGLNSGDKVVTHGQIKLRNGEKVMVKSNSNKKS